MIQFNIGNLVFLRSNCEYNTDVATGKRVLLIPGKYSCEKDEMNTTLVCVMKPFKKTVLVNKYGPFGYTVEYEQKTMIRVMSTATHKVYDVDAEWCDLIPDKKAYDEVRDFTLLDNAINDEFLDMCDYADDLRYIG